MGWDGHIARPERLSEVEITGDQGHMIGHGDVEIHHAVAVDIAAQDARRLIIADLRAAPGNQGSRPDEMTDRHESTHVQMIAAGSEISDDVTAVRTPGIGCGVVKERVIAAAAGQPVLTGAAGQLVTPAGTVKPVAAIAAEHEIGALSAEKAVGLIGSDEPIGFRCAIDGWRCAVVSVMLSHKIPPQCHARQDCPDRVPFPDP